MLDCLGVWQWMLFGAHHHHRLFAGSRTENNPAHFTSAVTWYWASPNPTQVAQAVKETFDKDRAVSLGSRDDRGRQKAYWKTLTHTLIQIALDNRLRESNSIRIMTKLTYPVQPMILWWCNLTRLQRRIRMLQHMRRMQNFGGPGELIFWRTVTCFLFRRPSNWFV